MGHVLSVFNMLFGVRKGRIDKYIVCLFPWVILMGRTTIPVYIFHHAI